MLTAPQISKSLGHPASPAEVDSLKSAPLSTLANVPKKATLYGADNAPTVVDVGSGQAANLQGQGYGLTPGSFKAPNPLVKNIGGSTFNNPADSVIGNTMSTYNKNTGQTNSNFKTPGGANDIRGTVIDPNAPAVSPTITLTDGSTIPNPNAPANSTAPTLPQETTDALKQYQSLNDQITSLNNYIANQEQTILGSGDGSMSEAQAKNHIASANIGLINQVKALTEQAKNAYNTYTQGVKNYQYDQNQASKQQTFLSGLASKNATAARANADKILTSVANGTLDIKSLNPSDVAKLESDAGMPVGMLENILPKLANQYQTVKSVTTSDGSLSFVGLTKTGEVKVIKTGVTPKTTAKKATTTVTKTPTFKTSTAIPEMSGAITPLLGAEGYLSKEDWSTLLSQWNKAGGSTSSFISNFKQYANPALGYNYQGIKPVTPYQTAAQKAAASAATIQ